MEATEFPSGWKGQIMRPVSISTARPTVGFQLSIDTAEHIHGLAQENGVSDTDLMKLGIALAEILTQAKREGHRLAIVDREGRVVRDVARPQG
jgi:hypothetical protein